MPATGCCCSRASGCEPQPAPPRGGGEGHDIRVTVEVCVEGGADEWVDLDGLAFDKLWLEGLDAETGKRRRTVEQHGVLRDGFLEHVPDDRTSTLDHALGGLDVLSVAQVNKALHDE